jgi:hypothetical protein
MREGNFEIDHQDGFWAGPDGEFHTR